MEAVGFCRDELDEVVVSVSFGPDRVIRVSVIRVSVIRVRAVNFDQLKSIYRGQLKRDPTKEFGSEFVRTTDLERSLIDEHGFEAIRFIFEDRNGANYFPLGEFPSDCPWSTFNGMNIQAAIDAIFSSIAERLPNLMPALKQRCSHVYAEKTDASWKLHYMLDTVLYDGRRYYQIYSGGRPNPTPDVNSILAEYDWKIPDELKQLYAVHDGFGPVLGSQDISVMARMMDPICQQQNVFPEGYRFADLLEFHPDDAGNAQCFHRTESQQQGDPILTVDWDHEVWEISQEQDFFEHLDDRLTQLDEE